MTLNDEIQLQFEASQEKSYNTMHHQLQFLVSTLIIVSCVNGQFNFNSADFQSKFTLPTAATASPLLIGNSIISNNNENEACTCAAFMSGQFKKGSSEQPKGLPALIQETDIHFPCTSTGVKMCINKCLETIIKHLPNSPSIICGTIDRDCHRERAYLFVKNCDASTWINSNLSAGREYCCKSGEPVSCLEPLKL